MDIVEFIVHFFDLFCIVLRWVFFLHVTRKRNTAFCQELYLWYACRYAQYYTNLFLVLIQSSLINSDSLVPKEIVRINERRLGYWNALYLIYEDILSYNEPTLYPPLIWYLFSFYSKKNCVAFKKNTHASWKEYVLINDRCFQAGSFRC